MVIFLTYLSVLTFFVIVSNKYLINKKFLISETGDRHQKFTSKINTPLTGGILIFFSFLYSFNQLEMYFIFFSSMIFLLGIFSDMKLIKSAKLRLFFQVLLIIAFVILSKIQIDDTRVYLLDELLKDKFFNYIFVIFCILVVVNGSNFFDGLNTLNIGYYLLVSLVVFLLNFNLEININELVIMNLISVLLIAFILNFFNKIFLGDSGSYLLGFIFSVFLFVENLSYSCLFVVSFVSHEFNIPATYQLPLRLRQSPIFCDLTYVAVT